jgi:hypothetical protein
MKIPIQIASGIGLIVCCILSLCPLSLARGPKAWSLYLPIVGTLFYGIYEVLMPVEMNIRIDMAFILPMLLFLWLNGFAKLAVSVAMARARKRDQQCAESFPQRRIQVALTAPILLACFLWFAKIWWWP